MAERNRDDADIETKNETTGSEGKTPREDSKGPRRRPLWIGVSVLAFVAAAFALAPNGPATAPSAAPYSVRIGDAGALHDKEIRAGVIERAGVPSDAWTPGPNDWLAANHMQANGGFALRRVGRKEMVAAIAASPWPQPMKEAMLEQVRQGRDYGLLGVYDASVQDGDVIEIQAGGWSARVELLSEPTWIPMPPNTAFKAVVLSEGQNPPATLGFVLPSGGAVEPCGKVGNVFSYATGRLDAFAPR